MSLRDTVLDILKVPPQPAPPPGSPPRVFRAAPNYYTLKLIRWGIGQVAALFGILFALTIFASMRGNVPGFVGTLLQIGEGIALLLLVFSVLFGWILVRFDYELRWYMLSDRAIRIREGITTIREKTIALANIQNIEVKQGPLQRYLGLADVEVKTAGGGGSSSDAGKKGHAGDPMHVAYFRGVANAEQIRDLLREGVRRQKDSGLGDPDEVVHAPGDAHEAAEELVREARALRQTVARNRGTRTPLPSS